MNCKSISWNSYLETLRVEIDQAVNGCDSLSNHHNKFERVTIELSHFSKKLIDFVDEKRVVTPEDVQNFQGLIKILLNLNHFIDEFSDFCIDKTIKEAGVDFFISPLNQIIDFINNFNNFTQQLELPQIIIDQELLKTEDNIKDIIKLLEFIQARALFYERENKDYESSYKNLTNEVFNAIESEEPDNPYIKELFIKRKEFLSRKSSKYDDSQKNGLYYDSKDILKVIKEMDNVKIIDNNDIDVDRSHCVYHGKNSNFFSGVLKPTKKIVSFEIFHSIIFSENEFNSFVKKVKIMNESKHYNIIPLIGIVVEEPFMIVSEFMPERSLYFCFRNKNGGEFDDDNENQFSVLESDSPRKFKMQFDYNDENLKDTQEIVRPRKQNLHMKSTLNYYSYKIHKESNPHKKEISQTVVALGVAYALRYLHSKQIVHMEVKLSEIFLDANGRPKLKCSKRAMKVNSDFDKIESNDVKAWTAPELIYFYKANKDSTDTDNDMDDEMLDEESLQISPTVPREPRMIHHSSSISAMAVQELRPVSHYRGHSHISRKDSKRSAVSSKKNLSDVSLTHSSGSMPIISTSDPNAKNVFLTNKVDVYAFGIMLWELLTKEIAFKSLSSSLIAKEVTQNDKRPLIPQNCPLKLANLIQQCWHKDPNERPTFEDICTMFESGNYNFPGTDTEEFNAYKAYCSKLNDKINDDNILPDEFYSNPNLSVEEMINAFSKEGSCEDIRFIKKLSELVKKSVAARVPQSHFSLLPKKKTEDNSEIMNSQYIFNETSLSILSSFFLSSNLDIRLIAVDLVTFIYNNHMFNDERSISVILSKIVKNISQISSLSTHSIHFNVTEAQETVLTSMKLLELLSSKYVTSGFINNKISTASINSIINMAFSECSELREISFDFYISFLTKFQASNKLLMKFVTKLAHFNIKKATRIECIKIMKIIQLCSRNERLFILMSLDEKTLDTLSQFLIYDKISPKQGNNEEEEEGNNENENGNNENGNNDAANLKFVLNIMKSNNSNNSNLLTKMNHKESDDDVVIASLHLLFTLVSGSQYLHYYARMANDLAQKLLSKSKIISSISSSILCRLIPAIGESKVEISIPEDIDVINNNDESIPEFHSSNFDFLTDDILLKVSENLDDYTIRLFGAISSSYLSAPINIRNDEIILQRILKKMKESLKPIQKSNQQAKRPPIEPPVKALPTPVIKNQGNDDQSVVISGLFNKISLNMQPPKIRQSGSHQKIIMRNKLTMDVSKKVDAFPVLFNKGNDAFNEEEKKREEEGKLAALVLQSQSSQTPSSKVLYEAIDIFFEYYFFVNYETVNNNNGTSLIANNSSTFEEEEKLKQCLMFLSNMSLDPKAALCIFNKIDRILHITSLKNLPAASTFFHVTLTYEVQEKIRGICKKYLGDDDSGDEDDTEEDLNEDKIELLNGRTFPNLIEDIILKCLCFWNAIYFEDAMRLLEFFSTIPSARKIFVKHQIDSKIRSFIKTVSAHKHEQQPISLEIQQQKLILDNLKHQQKRHQKLYESLETPKNEFGGNNSSNLDETNQEQLFENQQKNLVLLRQIKRQKEKYDQLKMKVFKIKNHDSNMRILCNRILARFV